MDTNNGMGKLQRQRAIFRGDSFTLAGARVGAVAAIFTFIAFYVLTIQTLGPWIGVGIGWLPSAILAWTAANVVAPLSARGLRSSVCLWKSVRMHRKGSRSFF